MKCDFLPGHRKSPYHFKQHQAQQSHDCTCIGPNNGRNMSTKGRLSQDHWLLGITTGYLQSHVIAYDCNELSCLPPRSSAITLSAVPSQVARCSLRPASRPC
jgi:hypothetical protein